MEGKPVTDNSRSVTEEAIQTAIRCKDGCDDVIVKTIEIEELDLENLVSHLFRVRVECEKNGSKHEYRLFIKVIRDNETIKHVILAQSKFYQKERMTYEEIIPDMIKYQKHAKIEVFGPSVPSYYYSEANERRGIISLEDIQSSGYISHDPRSCLNFEQCKLALTELARFHALSFAIKSGHVDNLKKYNLLFHDGGVSQSGPLSPYLTNGFKASMEIIKSLTKDRNTQITADKISKIDLLQTLRDLVKPIEPFALICHGDIATTNIAFKYDNTTNRPIAAKLVDFQLVRYALPSTDLSYFFFVSTTRELRIQHMRSLLLHYHTTFMECLNNVNMECPQFTFQVLEEMFVQTALYGIIFAFMLLPFILATPEDRKDLQISGTSQEELETTFISFFNQILNNKENIPNIEERIIGVLEDATEIGVI